VKRSSCRNMLRQEEVPFIKATSTLQLSPALKELKSAMSLRKKPVVLAGSRCPTSERARDSQQLAGKRKANEPASSSESMWSDNRLPGPGAGSSPLPVIQSRTTKLLRQSRKLGPSEEGVTYASLLVGTVSPRQLSRSLKPTAKDSDPFELCVSFGTTNSLISSDMSRSLSDKPECTILHAQVGNTSVPAGERPNKTRIFILRFGDTRSSMLGFEHPALAV